MAELWENTQLPINVKSKSKIGLFHSSHIMFTSWSNVTQTEMSQVSQLRCSSGSSQWAPGPVCGYFTSKGTRPSGWMRGHVLKQKVKTYSGWDWYSRQKAEGVNTTAAKGTLKWKHNNSLGSNENLMAPSLKFKENICLRHWWNFAGCFYLRFRKK